MIQQQVPQQVTTQQATQQTAVQQNNTQTVQGVWKLYSRMIWRPIILLLCIQFLQQNII